MLFQLEAILMFFVKEKRKSFRPIYDKSQQHPGALPTNEVFTHQNNGVGIPHSQSLIGGAGSSVIRQPRMFRQQQHQQQFANRADTPLVFHRTNYRVFPVDYQPSNLYLFICFSFSIERIKWTLCPCMSLVLPIWEHLSNSRHIMATSNFVDVLRLY